jgi:hypothetical protein
LADAIACAVEGNRLPRLIAWKTAQHIPLWVPLACSFCTISFLSTSIYFITL